MNRCACVCSNSCEPELRILLYVCISLSLARSLGSNNLSLSLPSGKVSSHLVNCCHLCFVKGFVLHTNTFHTQAHPH